MFRVFNMGIGYILVVDRDQSMKAIDHLSKAASRHTKSSYHSWGQRRTADNAAVNSLVPVRV